MYQPAIFILEAMASIHQVIAESLLGCGFEVISVSEKNGLRRMFDSRATKAVILGPSTVCSRDDFELAQQIREFASAVPLVLVVANSSEELAISALQAGINGYVKYPFAGGELLRVVRRCAYGPEEPAKSPVLNQGDSRLLRRRKG